MYIGKTLSLSNKEPKMFFLKQWRVFVKYL